MLTRNSIWLITLLLAFIIICYANNEAPSLTFNLISNNKISGNFNAEITLDKIPHAGKWQLAFNSIREPFALKNATFLEQKQGGDFYLIELNIPENKKQFSFEMTGKFAVNNYTDAPSGYFLIDSSTRKIIPLQAKTILPDWQPKPGEDEESREKVKLHSSIEGNPIETSLRAETSLIIPIPAELERKEGYFSLNKNTIIFYDEEAKKIAQFFAKSIAPATGYLLELKAIPETKKENFILFTRQGTDSFTKKQRAEGYILEVRPSSIIIRALSVKGFFYGMQSLRQLMPAKIYSQTVQSDGNWQIPSLFIFDYPRFEYRGLMLDVARNFRSVSEIKRLLDLMAMHKLNYFQWHLTDDEGWRIEIKKYPQLTNIGAWRGYPPEQNDELALMPAYGSGPASSGGFYTQQEIREIVTYAAERQITIIPEIDLPGHARALIVSLKQLRDPNNSSQYSSVQGYHDNVLSLCNRETLPIIADILTEVANLFPGKYIHVGGDEVPKGAWQKSCMADKYDPKDPRFGELVQNEFMQEIQTIIQAKGKLMAGWEEVAGESSTLAAPLRTYIWNASKIDQVYKNSEIKGYELIMSPAENLYLDLAYNADPKEPGQYWAGYVDTFSVYSFKPIDRLKGQSEELIKGVQGQLWSELIPSAERLEYFAFPKMSALAELAWSLPTRRNWHNFSDRMREKHLQRLDYYGVYYRKKEFMTKP